MESISSSDPNSSLNGAAPQAIYNANFTDLPIDIASFFRALWRRKLFIIGIWLFIQSLAIYSAFTSTPIYQSGAALELKVLPALPKSELHSETSMSKVNEKKYMEAMKRLLGSRKLAMMVIKELNLHKTKFNFPLIDENAEKDMEHAESTPPDTESALQKNLPTDSEEELIKSVVGFFLANLSVSIEKGGVTGVINLSYTDESPKLCTDILSTLIDQFWLIMYERPEVAFSKERHHMSQMISQAKVKLDEAYDLLNTFLSGNDIFFLENIDVMTKKDIEITSSQLLELSKKSEEASIERIQAQSIWERAKADHRGIKAITDNYLITTLKEELAMAEAEMAKLRVLYAPGQSIRQSVAAKIKSLKNTLQRERTNIMETLRHNFETASLKENNLRHEVDKMKNYVIQKKALKGEYDAIEAEIEINRKVYQSVLQQYEALKIETLFPFTLNMIDPPLIPIRPIKPKKELRVVIGFVIGMVFGCSLALLIEFTNPGLRAPVEAERRTGLPMLGVLPPMKKRKKKASLNQFEHYKYLEGWPEFNQSFNDVIGILLSKPGISVSVTSPKAKEEKTLVALGIARQLIGAGKKVLLIDADFSGGKLDQLFDLEKKPGLLEILEKKIAAPDFSHSVNELRPVLESAGKGKLYALKSGRAHKKNTPLGLIETSTFIKLMAQYRSEVDYMIVITPPLLREVATYIINRVTDTTLLILRERQSKIKDAVRATEVMVRVGISILGLIVTESESFNK